MIAAPAFGGEVVAKAQARRASQHETVRRILARQRALIVQLEHERRPHRRRIVVLRARALLPRVPPTRQGSDAASSFEASAWRPPRTASTRAPGAPSGRRDRRGRREDRTRRRRGCPCRSSVATREAVGLSPRRGRGGRQRDRDDGLGTAGARARAPRGPLRGSDSVRPPAERAPRPRGRLHRRPRAAGGRRRGRLRAARHRRGRGVRPRAAPR